MDTPITLKQELLANDRWLLDELGFRIIGDSYSERAMGGSWVGLESAALRLSFLRDRGSTRAEIAPRGESPAWELSLVLEAISGVRPHYAHNLHDAAALVRDNLAALTHALGPAWAETRQELERRERLWLRDAMTPHPVSPRNRLLLNSLLLRRLIRRLWIPALIAFCIWLISR
jgi:hypothetical protein